MLVMFQQDNSDKHETAAENTIDQSSSDATGTWTSASKGNQVACYLLESSVDDVLELIKSSGDAVLLLETQQNNGLRIMWPAYFYRILDDRTAWLRVLVDVDESGFGVLIQTDIDVLQYPEIIVHCRQQSKR